MSRDTVTFKCDICGQMLTFYKDSFSYDGCSCPICDELGMKPILKPIRNNVFYGKKAVIKTREMYKEQSEKYWAEHPNGMTLEQALNN
jgi:hypothetical protein